VLAAQARVDQARAALAQSLAEHGQVAVSTAQASSASAAVKQAQANLAAAELQLSLHNDHRAGRWRRYEKDRAGRTDRATRPGVDDHRSAPAHLVTAEL